MSDRLFDPGPADGNLTDRQQRALDAITGAGWAGLKSDELGAVMHAPKHGLHERCSFCTSAGYELASGLRARGLVELRRRTDPKKVLSSVWVAVGAPQRKRAEREKERIPY